MRGLSIKEGRKLIQEKLNKHYVNFDLSVNVVNQRKIRIYVVGEVKNPGSYDVSSYSTILTALQAAKGPTKIGTLRNIELIKASGKKYKIDLYEYLMQGDKSQDLSIEQNDTVLVPVIGPTIQLTGEVKRPGIYEIKKRVNLKDAVNYFSGVICQLSIKKGYR